MHGLVWINGMPDCPHTTTNTAPLYTCRTGAVETMLETCADCGAQWVVHQRKWGGQGDVGQAPNRLPEEADFGVDQEVE